MPRDRKGKATYVDLVGRVVGRDGMWITCRQEDVEDLARQAAALHLGLTVGIVDAENAGLVRGTDESWA